MASLARPGGNITGMANQIETVSAKNLELLKESKPGIKRVGIIFSPTMPLPLGPLRQCRRRWRPASA